MSTIRVAKRARYTTIDRRAINDNRLTYRARGILAWLLDKPDDWQVTRESIAEESIEGVSAIRTALQELTEFGYLVRTKTRLPSGQLLTETVLRERPSPEDGNQPAVDQPAVHQPAANQPAANQPAENQPPRDRRLLPKTVTEDCPEDETKPSESSDGGHPRTEAFAREFCELMAELIVANGSKRPDFGTRWLPEAELMFRSDGRKPSEAAELLRWVQADEFWKGNVMSAPTFRRKYDQLRLAMERNNAPPPWHKPDKTNRNPANTYGDEHRVGGGRRIQ